MRTLWYISVFINASRNQVKLAVKSTTVSKYRHLTRYYRALLVWKLMQRVPASINVDIVFFENICWWVNFLVRYAVHRREPIVFTNFRFNASNSLTAGSKRISFVCRIIY